MQDVITYKPIVMTSIKRLLTAIHKVFGYDEKSLMTIDIEKNTRRHTLARRILCHLYVSNGGLIKTLQQHSSLSSTTWSKGNSEMKRLLKTSEEAKILYEKVKTLAFSPKPIKKKIEYASSSHPTLAIKWTVLDEIRIDRAKALAQEFMNNYGKAR